MKFVDRLNRWISPAGLILLTLFAAFLLVIGAVVKEAYAAEPSVSRPDIIEVIEIGGEIYAGAATALKAQVEKINENPKIKAVVLVVNSPGGGATASAVMYQELGKIKVPVVGLCEYICASGGVYALMAPSVKYIGVSDETIGGSVGVVMHMSRYHRLLDWAKIDSETYRSGHLKDAGNPTRPGNDTEKAYLQGIVDELAVKFYHVVGKARPKLKPEQWAQIKTAKIFIGPHIVAVGLADAVMTRDQAIRKAKELSGSKLAFTREELGKMSKAAHETTSYQAPPALSSDPRADRALDDLHFFVNMAREIRAGEAVRFEYRAPYSF